MTNRIKELVASAPKYQRCPDCGRQAKRKEKGSRLAIYHCRCGRHFSILVASRWAMAGTNRIIRLVHREQHNEDSNKAQVETAETKREEEKE